MAAELVLGDMTRFLPCLAIVLAVSCGNPPAVSIELETLKSDEIESWIGASRSDLVSVWGEPGKESSTGSESKLVYSVINIAETIEKSDSNDFESGPKTQGVDNDTLSLVRDLMRNSCTVTFLLDNDRSVKQALLQRFKGANECNSAKIYSAN